MQTTRNLTGGLALSALVKSVCVPPDEAAKYWSIAAPFIADAMRRGGMGTNEAVKDDVMNGRALLWCGVADGRAHVWAVTELQDDACVVVAASGGDRRTWLHCLRDLEAYGRAEGKKHMRIFGRKGWARVLPEYRTARIVLERAL